MVVTNKVPGIDNFFNVPINNMLKYKVYTFEAYFSICVKKKFQKK